MSNDKKIRKLSLSYIRDTLVRKTTSKLSHNHTTENNSSYSALVSGNGPSHHNSSSLQTDALDLATHHQNGAAGQRVEYASDSTTTSSSCSTWKQQRDKSILGGAGGGLLKTLRRRFQIKSNTEPNLKIKYNTIKNVSNSSHEIFRSSKIERGILPLPECNNTYTDHAGNNDSADEALYTETQSVLVDLNKTGNTIGGYETCDGNGNDNDNIPPKSTSLSCQLLKLSHCGWYWGPISREESEEKLENQPDGAFLVRDSSADRYLLSLSFRSNNRTLHTRIEHSFGLFSFYSHPEQEGFGSIVELIDNSMHFSQSGVFCYSRPRSPGYPAFPVRLTKPISRFTQVRSLQYLCRFVIRQNTRVDNIGKLPLPTSLKGYLEEGHY